MLNAILNKILKKNRRISVFLLAVVYSTVSFSQNLEQDLKKVGESYEKATNFGADLVIEVQYAESSPLQLFQKATIRKKQNEFYYSVGNAETVVTNKLLIMINKDLKTIFFRELEKQEQELIAKKYYQSGIDSITSKYDSATYIGIGKYGKHYVIYSAKNMISKTDLFTDITTGYINRVVYNYNKKLSKDLIKVVISFAYPGLNTSEEKLLKEDTYLVKTGTNYKPAQKYLNYELNKVDNE